MSNYKVDIDVKVRGEELKQFGDQLEQTKKQVNGVNRFLDTFKKKNIRVNESISNLNSQLREAKETFRNATIGTKQQVQAAKDLLQANENLNTGLKKQQDLLDKLSGPSTADNKKLQEGLLKLETKQTRKLEERFATQQEFQQEFKNEINKINQQRQEENKLLKQNVQQTKETVAEEIKKKFSIMAAHKERRKNIQISEKEIERTKGLIPINDRINAQLKKRGLILSSNGKKIIKNNTNRSAGGRGGRFQNALQSGIIGGGFPLLFGQGPTAAVGGALGGVAGGAIGGQLGFALSIAGTTIGSALDNLANALANPTKNIEKLIEKFGLVGTETGDLASELEKLGLKSAAATLLLEEGKEKFGLTTDEIKKNTEQLEEFKNSMNILGTELTLFLSDALQPIINDLLQFRKGKGITRNIVDFILFGPGGNPVLKERIKGKKGKKMSNIPPAEGEAIIGGVKLNPDFKKNPNLERLKILKEQKQLNLIILPLQQALEIEQQRSSLTNDELSILKAKNNLKRAENTLSISKQELQISSNTLGSEELKNLEEKIKKERILVNTAKAALTNAENAKTINDMKNQASLADLDNRIKLQKESLTLLPKEFNILQQKNKLSSLESALDIAKAENNQSKVNNLSKQIELQNILIEQAEILANPIQSEMIMLDQQMKQLNDVGMRVVGLSQTIGLSFQESFKGVIMGTMSVTDAFRNMTSKIADYFLDMAARMMANQLQRSILGMFGGGLSSVPFVQNLGGAGFTGEGGPSPLLGFADGGRPPVGRPSIVGERGPELFVPNGAGTIIPNHAMGGMNVVVNVDASGSSVQGADQSANEFGEQIAAAVQAVIINEKRVGGLLN